MAIPGEVGALRDAAPAFPARAAAALSRAGAVAARQGDRIIPWAALVLIAGTVFTVTWLRSYTLEPGYDRAYFKQAVWLVDHGKPLFISARGLYLMGDHASPLIYPVAWVAGLFPHGGALLAIQALAVGTGGFFLYRFGRIHAHLGQVAATFLVVAYAGYPALHNMVLAGFHPEVLALPALIAATHFALGGRWVPYAGCLAVVLASKEDMAIVAASLAFLLLVKGARRAAVVTFVVSVAWLAFAVGWLSPHFAGGEYVQQVRFGEYGETMGEAARFMLTHPFQVLGDLFTTEKFTKLTALLGPLLFLPLLSPAFLFPALPFEFLLLTATYAPPHTIDYHYTVAFAAFGFMATAMTLGRLQVPPRFVRQLAAVAVVATAFFFVQYAKDSPIHRPWSWRTRDAADEARLAAHRAIPKDAAVSVNNGLLDLFSDRQFVYNLPMPFVYYTEIEPDPIPLADRRRRVDYAVVDLNDAWVFPNDRAEVIDQVLPSWGFERLWERDGIIVFRRTDRPDAPGA